MKGVVRLGFILVVVSLSSGLGSRGHQTVQVEPVREQEFVGHLEGRDFYRTCRRDSNGNLFLRTRYDVIQKISVDGSQGYEIDFRGHLEIPMGIHDIAVGPDDVLYVVGVDLAGTATFVYRILPGESWPVLFERIPALDPCRCAVSSDFSLHMVSFETGWINSFFLGSLNPETNAGFDRSTQSIWDVAVRRFSRDGRALAGYEPIRLPLENHQLQDATRDLCNKLLAPDRDGGTHLLDARTGICVCYSTDGTRVGESRLELDSSEESTPVILQMVSLGAGFFTYKVAYLDSENLIKWSDLIVANHQTGIQRKIELLKGGMLPYQLDIHERSDELMQYWFIKERILTVTYKISDLLKE